MAKIIIRGEYFWFNCPACGPIMLSKAGWDFNGDVEKPTIRPSVLSKRHGKCLCGEEKLVSCHSFITDGHIEFLADSNHEFAGQTLELPDMPEGLFE